MFAVVATKVANENLINEVIKNRLKLCNACYPSENHLSFCLLFKNAKIKIYKPIILPRVLYACEGKSID
jgi:hypothetical protein